MRAKAAPRRSTIAWVHPWRISAGEPSPASARATSRRRLTASRSPTSTAPAAGSARLVRTASRHGNAARPGAAAHHRTSGPYQDSMRTSPRPHTHGAALPTGSAGTSVARNTRLPARVEAVVSVRATRIVEPFRHRAGTSIVDPISRGSPLSWYRTNPARWASRCSRGTISTSRHPPGSRTPSRAAVRRPGWRTRSGSHRPQPPLRCRRPPGPPRRRRSTSPGRPPAATGSVALSMAPALDFEAGLLSVVSHRESRAAGGSPPPRQPAFLSTEDG